eukprot:jgi/Galph1/5199/GphlegSOOS_G3826.1
MVICKYFLKGNCKFGKNCKNEHPQQGFGSTPFTERSSWRDSFQSSNQRDYFSNASGGNRGNNFGGRGGRNPFSESRSSTSSFYRNQPRQDAMDTSYMEENVRGRGHVGFQRGRGRGSHGRLEERRVDGAWDVANAAGDKLQVSWPFTSYGLEYGPNIIDGDISFEELRAEAYAAASQGVPLAQIVERERSLAEQYQQKQLSMLHSSNASQQTNHVTGIVAKDPFQNTDGMGSNNLMNFGGMSSFSVGNFAPMGYSNLSQDLSNKNKNDSTQPNGVTGMDVAGSVSNSVGPQKTDAFSSSFSSLVSTIQQQPHPQEQPLEQWKTQTEMSKGTDATEISEVDKEQYLAASFTLGKVPELPPSDNFIQ